VIKNCSCVLAVIITSFRSSVVLFKSRELGLIGCWSSREKFCWLVSLGIRPIIPAWGVYSSPKQLLFWSCQTSYLGMN